MNVHSSIGAQWASAVRFCLFAIMPIGGLVHFCATRIWVAMAFSPLVLFSAGLSLSKLGSSLTEYELSDAEISKVVVGRTVGVLPYDKIEKVRVRKDRWCYVKGGKQTFFFVPEMEGYDECLRFLENKLQSPDLIGRDPDPPNTA